MHAHLSARRRVAWRVLVDDRGQRRVPLKATRTVDVSSVRVSRSGGSLPVPDGAYAAVPVWSTREQWRAAVDVARESPEGVELRRVWAKRWVADDAFGAIVDALASFADHRTGRGITAAHATIATRAGLLPRDVDTTTVAGQRRVRAAAKRVQQVTRILEAFGLYQLVRIGRPASRREIAALRAEGITGAMTGNEAALTVPAHLARAAAEQAASTPDERAIFHLPSAPEENRSSYVSETPSKPRTRRTDASRPGQRGSSSRRAHPKTPLVPLSERPPAFRRLVAGLDAAVIGPGGQVTGRFTQGRSVLGLVRILDDFGIDASWSAEELLRRILRWEPHYRFRDGLAWIRHRLARAFQRPTTTTPVPPAPPEFRGHSDLLHLWASNPTYRDGWYQLQTLRAAQDTTAATTSTNTPAAPERAPDRHTAPRTAVRREQQMPDWRRELDAAQARLDAEDDAARVAAIAAARAAGTTTVTRSRIPYVPGR